MGLCGQRLGDGTHCLAHGAAVSVRHVCKCCGVDAYKQLVVVSVKAQVEGPRDQTHKQATSSVKRMFGMQLRKLRQTNETCCRCR
jgi:hypothetical protein